MSNRTFNLALTFLFLLYLVDLIFSLVVFSNEPQSPIIHTNVTLLEENTVYDTGNNTVLLKQFVFWDEDGRVIAWRFIKRSPCYVGRSLLLLDGELLRRVSFESRMRSGSYYDVELQDRDVKPQCERRELGSRP